MRRATLAVIGLVIPAALAAQVMIPTRRQPDRPAEKPPQAPGIHDVRSYNRYRFSRFSLESAPMISYMETTGLLAPGLPGDYWGFGDQTLLSFRTAPSLYLTGAFTASSVGMPFGMNSSDVGIRVKPWTSPRVTPFADARMSWAFTSGNGIPSSVVPVILAYGIARENIITGSGRGAVFGLGADTRLTARYSITTTLSRTHYAMRGTSLEKANRWSYANDATRLSIGLRYNHGRWLDAP